MGAPGGDARHFLEWADDEGAEVALGAVLAELRGWAKPKAAERRFHELLTVAESLTGRVADELRAARAWEGRRLAVRAVIAAANDEVRRAIEAEGMTLARKRNRVEGAEMVRRAAAQLTERLEQPVRSERRAVKEAAERLRAVAAMAAAHSMITAVLGDDDPGAALTVAHDTLAGIRDASRRDGELTGVAACLLEALHRGGMPLDKAAKDVARMLEGRSITPRNAAPMLADHGAVKRWRDRLSEGSGPEARRRVWRQFMDWADKGKHAPYWLSREAQKLRQAVPSNANRGRLATLHRAPAETDGEGWRLVADEVRQVLARLRGL